MHNLFPPVVIMLSGTPETSPQGGFDLSCRDYGFMVNLPFTPWPTRWFAIFWYDCVLMFTFFLKWYVLLRTRRSYHGLQSMYVFCCIFLRIQNCKHIIIMIMSTRFDTIKLIDVREIHKKQDRSIGLWTMNNRLSIYIQF